MRTENPTLHDAATDQSLEMLQARYDAPPTGDRRLMSWEISPAINAHQAAARVDAFFESINSTTHSVTIRQSNGVRSIHVIWTH